MNTSTINRSSTVCISWGAIIAGTVIAWAITSLLNLLGLGLNLIMFEPNMDTLTHLGVGTVVWLAINSIIAMYFGGWFSSKMSGATRKSTGVLHGLVTWALATVLAFATMTSSISFLLSSGASLVGSGLSLAGQGIAAGGKGMAQLAPQAGSAVKDMLPNSDQAVQDIQKIANQALTGSAKSDSTLSKEELKQQLTSAVSDWLSAQGDEEKADAAKQKLTTFLTENTNLTEQQIEQKINAWEHKYNQAKEKVAQKTEELKDQAKEAADKYSTILGNIALIVCLTSILGALASAIGGRVAAKPE